MKVTEQSDLNQFHQKSGGLSCASAASRRHGGSGWEGQSGKADGKASGSFAATLLYGVSVRARRAGGYSGPLQMKNRQLKRRPTTASA